VLESPALEQLHGDKRPALEFSNIVNRADIRMVESGGSARFATELLNRLEIVRNVVRPEFERNISAKARVFGL
jgi:hypothetical protein